MSDPSSLTRRLRERAAQCREMARIAMSPTIASELHAIADEYDEDANRLEYAPGRRRYDS